MVTVPFTISRMSSCGGVRQFGFCPQFQKFPHSKRPWLLQLKQQRWRNGNPPLISKHVSDFKFAPKAAAAASSSPAPADYSEQLLGVKPGPDSQKIAGVDQEELEDPSPLGDPDSCFCEFKGVKIHHKLCDPESFDADLSKDANNTQISENTKRVGLGLPIILFHGFGASLFSWNRVMKSLARVTGSKVLAFDRPAFGLTSRVDPSNYSPPASEDTKPLNPYSVMFSVLASLFFMDFLAADKAILMGHSAGSLVAVDTYFEAPERVAAMVLVAPAIFAPLTPQNLPKDDQRDRNNQKPEQSESINRQNPIIAIFSTLSKFAKYIVQSIMQIFRSMGDMINSLYKKALSTFLRSAIGVLLVRWIIDKFGTAAVRNAWYDSNQVTDDVLQGYVKPLRVKGWDRALVEYTVAMLTDNSSQSKPSLAKRLSEISCPVLIVTGDSDRLVPPWNSQRLSKIIPGSRLEVIKNCGHLPQEEKAEEFVSIVEKFLRRAFGASEEQQYLQAVT
ncbi:OLC1v1026987C1 [Oldenlandia corymbosa var. corymbosa]|uniref:OLC1v1026987C1 n=1 Tax=Oldenlandia corymbosa var. corymbosa TaxID=529605 RepID=A0AAV1CA83_OLDCO|nr:OLC1v1026987C1 [Oldenlandia corymbosa var. corymbosa]